METNARTLAEIAAQLIDCAGELGALSGCQSKHSRKAMHDGTSDPLVQLGKALQAEDIAKEKEFGGEFLANPAWNILLDLYMNSHEHRRVSITDACLASRVPTTTALRYISALEGLGWIERHQDPKDGRRRYLHLTLSGWHKLASYLASAYETRLIVIERDAGQEAEQPTPFPARAA